jgi:hypothetical protein
MVNFQYLYKGLCGLARAHQANSMAGHLGAAVVAGYFYGEEHPDLDDQVVAAVQDELERIIAGDEALWFDPAKAGVTIAQLFEPFPDEPPRPEQIPTIAQALLPNVDQLRESGHNVIFASIALRALHDHPQHARPSIIEGVVRLIQGFDNAKPGRAYYGKERGWIIGDDPSAPPDDLPMYEDEQAMATAVIDELIRSASLHRQGYGGLFHVINHATALTELSRFGYRDLARRGLAAHHHHLRLWRSLPDLSEELGQLQRAEFDPRNPEYWRRDGKSQWSAHLTHRVKTLYGFFSLLRYIEDADQRRQAEEQFLYLMA